MTRVLLLADTERVQRIFHDLAEQGVLQLQSASTLAQGEAELAASPPDFTFVQSRISGFSGEILLRHLDKNLPDGAGLLLLAGDAEDAAQAKKHGRVALDLALGDEMLERSIRALLAGEPLPAPAAADVPQAVRPAPAKTKNAPSHKTASDEPALPGQPAAAEPSAALPDQEPQPPAAEEPPPVTADLTGASSPFEEVMLRASARVAPQKLGELEVAGRADMPTADPDRDGLPLSATETAAGPEEASPAPFVGESVASALRRAEEKKTGRRPYLIIVPVLALIAIPLSYYLVGKRDAPAAPVQIINPAPAAKTVVKQEPQAPRGRGKANLPPMLEGTRLDADYGKSHPGWVRYIGLRGEYKLFKEKDLFKAMQVVAAGGGTIPDELFRKALKEFGGIDGYRVESSSQKGDYLVEQGAATGDAAVTIYRNKKDLKMKGFVVYYR